MRYIFRAILLLGILIGISILRDGSPLESSGESSKNLFRVGLRNDSGELESSIRIAPTLPTNNLPRMKDLSTDIPPSYQQGDQSSSVGFVLGYYLKSFTENRKRISPVRLKDWNKEDSNMTGSIFSPKYIYNSTNEGKDMGGSLLSGLLILKSKGILPWSNLPYQENDYKSRSFLSDRESLRFRIDDFFRMHPSNINQIKAQLNKENPIPVSLLFFNGYLKLKHPFILKEPIGEFMGAQAVLLIGYDDTKNSFLAMNSWGEDWGDEGRFWIDYKLFQQTAQSAYLVIDRPNLPKPSELKNLYPTDIVASQGSYTDRVRLSWNNVQGAIGYEIHRKRTISSTYQLIGISLENQFEDTGVQLELAYNYRISSVFPDETSLVSPSIVEGFASNKPSKFSEEGITGVTASRGTHPNRIHLKWNPVPGKREYHIFKYNPYPGQYQLLAKTNANEYIDKRPRRNGEIEFYRISLTGSLPESSKFPATLGYTSNHILSPPQSVTASKGDFSDRVELSWDSVNGAGSYKIYRYTDDSQWEELSETSENQFIDRTLKESQGYYSIITYSKLGIPSKASFPILGIISNYRERSITLPPPSGLESIILSSQHKPSLKLTWNPVQDAVEYKVYSRNIGGSWKLAGISKTNSFQEEIHEKNWTLFALASLDKNRNEGRKSKEYAFRFMPIVRDATKERSFGQDSKLDKFKGQWTTMHWDGKAAVNQVKLVIVGENSQSEEVQIYLNNKPIYKADYIQETKISDPKGRFDIALSETETSLNMEIRDRNIFPMNTSLSFLRE